MKAKLNLTERERRLCLRAMRKARNAVYDARYHEDSDPKEWPGLESAFNIIFEVAKTYHKKRRQPS